MTVTDCDRAAGHERLVAEIERTMPGEGDIELMCRAFKALGEPCRMKILLALMQGELCVYHIAEVTGGQQSATSHQLRILRDSNIIKSRREGKTVLYSIADEHVREIIEMSEKHLECAK